MEWVALAQVEPPPKLRHDPVMPRVPPLAFEICNTPVSGMGSTSANEEPMHTSDIVVVKTTVRIVEPALSLVSGQRESVHRIQSKTLSNRMASKPSTVARYSVSYSDQSRSRCWTASFPQALM